MALHLACISNGLLLVFYSEKFYSEISVSTAIMQNYHNNPYIESTAILSDSPNIVNDLLNTNPYIESTTILTDSPNIVNDLLNTNPYIESTTVLSESPNIVKNLLFDHTVCLCCSVLL